MQKYSRTGTEGNFHGRCNPSSRVNMRVFAGATAMDDGVNAVYRHSSTSQTPKQLYYCRIPTTAGAPVQQ